MANAGGQCYLVSSVHSSARKDERGGGEDPECVSTQFREGWSEIVTVQYVHDTIMDGTV